MSETKLGYDNCKTQAYQEKEIAYSIARDSTATLFRNRAQQLLQKANEYQNLAKLFDLLPKELEQVLYPYIQKELFKDGH